MAKISVIVPVHNTEEYLPTCLNSILNQTEESIEVIAINDCSTDNSLEIIKHYEKKYPYKMKVVNLTKNVGVSSARNIGLNLAQGEYIGFVDSDDIISLNMYENFYNLAKNYNVNIVVGTHFRIPYNTYLNQETFIIENRGKTRIVDYSTKEKSVIFESPSVWDKLFKHETIEDIKFLDGRIYEDIGFTYPLLLKEKKVVESISYDYGYRITKGSIMNSSTLVKSNITDIIDIALYAYQLSEQWHFDDATKQQLRDVLKASICKMTWVISKWDLKNKEKKELIEKMLSIANSFFPNILEMETIAGKRNNDRILNSMKEEYHIEQVPEKQLEFQKENLKRKIKTLSKNQKANR